MSDNDGGYQIHAKGRSFHVAPRRELDDLPCESCGKAHAAPLVLEPRCHIGAGTEAVYFHGTLTLACKKCGKPIVAMVVSNEAPDPNDYEGGAVACDGSRHN